MDTQTFIRTDSPCILQDFIPFGTAAQKRKKKEKKKPNSKISLKDRKELKKKERNLKEKKIGLFFFTVLLFYVLSIRPQQSSFSQIVPPIVNKSAVHF